MAMAMEQIAISKFKVTCLAVIEEVRRTRRPIRVTRFGKPVAEVRPVSAAPKQSWLGCMRDSLESSGDNVRPIGAFDKWAARRP
jgi:antitoxin (DNA-binding transcriptional repressor) of toxin-antitoxin stability system